MALPFDLQTEKPIGLAEAAKLVGVHPITLSRWITAGVKASDGIRVRLQGIRAGNKWVTSHEALERFLSRLTPDFANETDGSGRGPIAHQPAVASA
jgi:hypothetical protein